QACAPSSATWDGINWAKVQRHVRRLQTRMVKALQAGRHNKVKALQWLLTHSFSGKAEPHRILWRLGFLRESSHEQEGNQVFPGSPGARSASGT
ncbi:TPA: reverse transcriptase N-terminal domain-containing protein, partial [Burkholderia vietnamiensis]|nr:reverse transcriptase N-terminal domain-containing protein [Burkholderia vietnamiensis]HDR9044146.1 reverse transcriptase N-terminal domain-containing protein [Burkholderia vietnamiensis]HDR9197731.1 reverse transcriptase N-terminal domain-containing protein [Burkholderia vietnamiensis]